MKLMDVIYNKYPAFLRHVIKLIVPNYEIERLAVKYGEGTWKQATAYFGVILKRSPSMAKSAPENTEEARFTDSQQPQQSSAAALSD
jgi:hypothetical protein